MLGEFDIRLLMQELTGRKASNAALPLGWGGDRFRLDEANGGPALVWISVWDEPRYRDWFLNATGAKFKARAKPGYKAAGRHADGEWPRRAALRDCQGDLVELAHTPGSGDSGSAGHLSLGPAPNSRKHGLR